MMEEIGRRYAMRLEHMAQRSGKLLTFLRKELNMSSTLVSRLKWQNAFFVNEEPAHTDHPVRAGDRILVYAEEQAEGYPAEKMDLSILYEDEWVIALDKPVGMLVHPSPSRNTGTLANGLRYYYEQTGQACAVHPISRLDRDTFGVVLLAKSAHVHAQFHRLQREGAMEKVYHASVFGGPEAQEGHIDLPIDRINDESLLRTVTGRGKPALTEYRVLHRWEQTALLELCPRTGRTHQLRVHCKYSDFPILGDPQYASDESCAYSLRHGIMPQQLCAKELAFVHPMTGARVEIHSKQCVICPENL